MVLKHTIYFISQVQHTQRLKRSLRQQVIYLLVHRSSDICYLQFVLSEN